MRCKTLFSALASGCLVLLGGCASSTSSSPPTSPSISLTGNWAFTAQSATGLQALVGTYLTSSGANFSGIAHISSSCYSNLGVDVPVSGSVDKNGVITATSPPVNGQVFAFTGTSSTDGTGISGGMYTITGGCAGGDSGSIMGIRYAALTGTFAGSVKSVSGLQVQASAALAEMAPAANGYIPESGTVTFSGSPCFGVTTIANPATDSLIIGNFFLVALTADSRTKIQVSGSFDVNAKVLPVQYSVLGGLCSGDSGTGTLSR
jgi:hypothetical protein